MRGRFVHTCGSCGANHPRPAACCGQATTSTFEAPGPAKPAFGTVRSAIKPNPKRRAETFAKNFGPQSRMCRFEVCAVPRCRITRLNGVIEPDHYVTRKGGGRDEHTWPLCQRHHRERHDLGSIELFEGKHGVLAEVVAGRLSERVEAHEKADECDAYAELEPQEDADRRAQRQRNGAIRRARCGVCLRRLPDDATRTP